MVGADVSTSGSWSSSAASVPAVDDAPVLSPSLSRILIKYQNLTPLMPHLQEYSQHIRV